MQVTLSELANWCGGELIPAEAGEQTAYGVSTDSRTIGKGEVFVAIDGLNQDGHHYIRFAASSGAVAAVVENRDHDSGRLPVILVDDESVVLVTSVAS